MKRVLIIVCIIALALAVQQSTKMQSLKNVVVVGGSYVGSGAATKLANALPSGYRVLLVEPHSHFHHLFAFPRFAIVPQHEHKAFIPYTRLFASAPAPNSHAVVQAKAVRVADKVLHLDRAWEEAKELPYEYLVIATGTKLPSPGSMQHDHKLGGVDFFKTYQGGIKTAQNIVIIGGGAVGVQMALDLKEFYPEKNVTLVHSRDKVMNRFHPGLDAIVRKRFDEVGVKAITGERVKLPAEGFPTDGTPTTVHTTNSEIPADLVILATGQVPNNQLVKDLDDDAEDKLTAPNGFLRVRPTLQLLNPAYSNVFALGDIADTGAPKAARPGMLQADVVVDNILSLIEGKEPTKKLEVGAAAIHLTLGLKQNVIFKNPDGDEEPMIKMRDDGQEDMGIEGVWTRRGFQVKDASEYHL